MAGIANLIGYYKFEGNGNDSSGNSRDLTAYGSPTYVMDLTGRAVDLESSSSQYFRRVDASFAFSGDKSISFRINPESFTSPMHVVHQYSGTTANRYMIWVAPTGYIKARFGDTIIITTSNQLSTGNDYNVVVNWTASGTVIDVYVNNSLCTKTSSTGSFDVNTNFNISRYGNSSNYFDGIMDNVCVWNTTLTAGEIAKLDTFDSLAEAILTKTVSGLDEFSIFQKPRSGGRDGFAVRNTVKSSGRDPFDIRNILRSSGRDPFDIRNFLRTTGLIPFDIQQIVGYNVYRDNNFLVFKDKDAVLSHADGPLSAGTYEYRVHAQNKYYEERDPRAIEKLVVKADFSEDIARPNLVSNIAIQNLPAGNMQINWTYDNQDSALTPTKFQIWVQTSTPINFGLAPDFEVNYDSTQSYYSQETGAKAQNTYYIGIRAATASVDNNDDTEVTHVNDATLPACAPNVRGESRE